MHATKCLLVLLDPGIDVRLAQLATRECLVVAIVTDYRHYLAAKPGTPPAGSRLA